MMYEENQLYDLILNSFHEDSYTGDQVELVAKILSKYLYLHQMIDVNILMEKSFLKSKKLNSKIIHAADSYYSVFRGTNRIINVHSIGCTEPVNAKKFDLIGSYGNYKLYYLQTYIHNEVFDPFSFNAYLALGDNTIEFNGNGKLYYDIEDPDISEDIEIYNKLTGEKYVLTNDIAYLYGDGYDEKADIGITTMQNYSIRLWCPTKFLQSNTYVVKYLKSPDKSVDPLDLSAMKSIPGFVKLPTTGISEISSVAYKNDNPELIYLYAATYAKFKDVLRSNVSIKTSVQEYFPEIKGFDLDISSTDIIVYYTTSYEHPCDPVNPVRVSNFNKKMKAYFINQAISFVAADVEILDGLTISIKYNQILDFATCEKVIKDCQYNIGQDFSPYQLIADLMSHPDLTRNIKRVDIPMELMNIVAVPINKRIYFTNLAVSYEAL